MTRPLPIAVAIIGHGPSMAGKGAGEVVDSHDIVVRMAECDFQSPEDYGVKYTIGVSCDGTSEKLRQASLRIPEAYWYYDTKLLGKTQRDGYQVLSDGVRVRTIQGIVSKWLKSGETKFSRGTASFIACCEILHPARITLFGFDDVARGYTLADGHGGEHPRELSRYLREKGISTFRNPTDHDWAREPEIIREVASVFGVEVVFYGND